LGTRGKAKQPAMENQQKLKTAMRWVSCTKKASKTKASRRGGPVEPRSGTMADSIPKVWELRGRKGSLSKSERARGGYVPRRDQKYKDRCNDSRIALKKRRKTVDMVKKKKTSSWGRGGRKRSKGINACRKKMAKREGKGLLRVDRKEKGIKTRTVLAGALGVKGIGGPYQKQRNQGPNEK